MAEALARFPDAAYIHPSVLLFGEVSVAEGASLWPYVVIRAEMHEVRIGRFTNVQDFVMIHVGYDTPTVVGDHCSITHHAALHGCTIGDNCLVGINATLMDGVVVGENSIVAGHALVSEGTVVPPNSIAMGTPARVVRRRNNFVANRLNAAMYHRNALAFRAGDHRAWTGSGHDAFMREEKRRLEALFAERCDERPLSD